MIQETEPACMFGTRVLGRAYSRQSNTLQQQPGRFPVSRAISKRTHRREKSPSAFPAQTVRLCFWQSGRYCSSDISYVHVARYDVPLLYEVSANKRNRSLCSFSILHISGECLMKQFFFHPRLEVQTQQAGNKNDFVGASILATDSLRIHLAALRSTIRSTSLIIRLSSKSFGV
jgi:hypothetical protein